MATTGRQTKGARKGPPEPTTRRTPAWTGARGSPTYSPSTASPRQPATQAPPIQASFPPLAQINGARPDNPRDRVLQSLSGLTGTTVTLQTKTSQRYEGVVGSTTTEGDTTGVTLKDVKDITTPGAPIKDQLFVASTNIESYASGPADAKPANGDSFRTDADISHKKGAGRERDLQAWVASGDTITLTDDDDTFGPGANGNTSWDQFTANETLFGVKASFDEDVYTTKLDRSAPDFKERERKAQRIANEIIGAATNNPHIAEERGLVDDSGVNEEDKYGAVVRGQNAYVPPGARKPGAGPPAAEAPPKADLPKVSVNGPDGASVAAQAQSPPSSKAASPAPPASGPGSNANKPPADPLPAFIAFVTNEKQRLTQKRQALVKSEMDKRMAELVKFSKDFKLNKPIPEDLVPILAKDEDKQRLIKEKASKDAASSQARAIGASNPTTASRGLTVAKNSDSTRKPITQALGSKIASNTTQASITAANAQKMANVAAASAAAAAAAATTTTTAAKPEGTTSKKISMVIQTIPPFRGKDKGKQNANAITTTSSTPVTANGASANTNQNTTNNPSRNSASPAVVPPSPNTVANRLNVNASSFRPNPKANAFNPVTPSPKMHAPTPASTSSPKPSKSDSAPITPNPFFGTRPIKKTPLVNIKDDFNPFKHNKVVDASQVATLWPYSGKRYMQLFPAPQHQPAQHPAHMAPPAPPPIPPPSYEEDSAAQAAAARGYVYAYPPYGYPAQHMMPGMPPPGPPSAYMPGPYMQPMPYPPGMPPPNAMYSPAMGQMPPPQGYMPPPPGAYPPPPNGAGPRPSMPPTPIQANAHPYYHQSPQLQHAYPMMMPPPPNIPPHGYEGGPPPVQMGGHS